ncbi:MAG TPA: twin-arginine translocase subunit TatC [Candidatus Limnocylindrales bacterium]|jgi:sec-independent protein translocase protein TatC|nr:twin-arginine translocase subunit TatC [Candidatus Limnocylindrales bacterium]
MTTVIESGPALGSMPLTAHLAELRNRLLWSIGAVLVGAVVGFVFGDPIIAFLQAQLPPDVNLQQIELGDGFAIQIQIALVVGVVLAMPVLLWHVWRFISPGLTRDERRAVLPWIPMALVFFAIGVSIAFVILPFAAQFLLSFVPPGVQRNINIRSYFDFITSLFLAFGILMEFPILLIGLSRVRIVTSERLARSRRLIILVIAIFSTVATPGGDLVSPTVLGLTLYILFEGTVFFIRRTGR